MERAAQEIADLRHRLDQADTDRRQALDRLAAAQERIAALLTDQRATVARRSWWRWRWKLAEIKCRWVLS